MNMIKERQYRAALRRQIQQCFNLTEIRVLCSELEIDFEELQGEGIGKKAIELVLYMERHKRTDELLQYLQKERPNTKWDADNLLKGHEYAEYVEIISKSKLDFNPKIHETKHTAKKIDMLGVSLYNFLGEIVRDSEQKMMKRLVDEDVRLRILFVNPMSDYLKQRSIEDDSKQLVALINRQQESIKNCLRFYKQLSTYYQVLDKTPDIPRGRVQIKLTDYCPYVSIERYDFDIFWSFYSSDTDGVHNPQFLATFEENYHVFDKLKKHFSQLMNERYYDESQNLFLVTMGVGGPCLNRTLAERLLDKETVASLID